MPPLNINPKYHSMPEKPHSHSCSQCGQPISDTTSGKCQNCGHLFDHRQFREHRTELPSSRHNTTSHRHIEKPIQDIKEPLSTVPDIKTEPTCPHCKNTVKNKDMINKKCPFCGYIGDMTYRQTDKIRQIPTESQER